MSSRRRRMAATQPRMAQTSVNNFQSRMDKRRAEGHLHSDLSSYHRQNQLARANNESDRRVENLRRMRRFQAQNAELQLGQRLAAEHSQAEHRRRMAEQEAALATTLQKRQNQKLSDEAHARRICDQSEELQQLKAQLKAAQMNKIRATQMAEKALVQQKDAVIEAQMDAEMERDRQIAMERQRQGEEELMRQNLARRTVLQDQIRERAEARKAAYEEFLKEKAVVDAIVAGIQAEDAAKREQAMLKQQELQRNISEYLEERRVWREQEKQRAADELAKIQQYQRMQAQRHAELMAAKKKKTEQHDAVLAQITQEIEQKRKEEEEMQNLLFELHQEEAEQKRMAAEQADRDRRDRMRLEMMEANEFQMALKRQQAVEQQAEEEEFRRQMLAKFAEDARLEQLSAARKRREILNYKAEVERLIQERREMYEAAKRAEMEENKQDKERAAYEQAIIDQERERLLREHAAELREYLPKGVVRNEQDFRAVYGQDAQFQPASVSEHSKSYSRVFKEVSPWDTSFR